MFSSPCFKGRKEPNVGGGVKKNERGRNERREKRRERRGKMNKRRFREREEADLGERKAN